MDNRFLKKMQLFSWCLLLFSLICIALAWALPHREVQLPTFENGTSPPVGQYAKSSRVMMDVDYIAVEVLHYDVFVKKDVSLPEKSVRVEMESDSYHKDRFPMIYQSSNTILIGENEKNWSVFRRNSQEERRRRYGQITLTLGTGAAPTLQLNTISGNIDVDAPSHSLGVGTHWGNILVTQPGKEIVVSAQDGSTEIIAPFERSFVNSSGGNVTIMTDSSSRFISASTIDGSVTLLMEDVSGYAANFESVHGKFVDEYHPAAQVSPDSSRFGDESLQIHASTIYGDFLLEDWIS